MSRPTRFQSPLCAAALLASLLAGAARADDKDLLKIKAVKPNVLIVFGNSQTTTNPLDALGDDARAWDGDADSPNSKMGLSKRVIRKFVAERTRVANFGLTRFASNPNAGAIDILRKHFLYRNTTAVTLSGGGYTFTLPAGVVWRLGKHGEGPCTNRTVPACTGASPAALFASVPPAQLPDDYRGGSYFFGGRQANKYQPAYLYITKTLRVAASLTQGLYGDAYKADLTTLEFVTHSAKVALQVQSLVSGSWENVTDATGETTTSADVLLAPLVVPAGVPRSDFFYTTEPDAGKQIGFLQNGFMQRNGSFDLPDFSVSANCSGWNFQSASAPLPLVKIPRDYVHGAACDQLPQNSVRCIQRVLRPQGVLIQYKYRGATDSDEAGYVMEDHDNPGYTGAGSKYADGCDATLLGAADPKIGLDIVEQQAVLTNRNGSQAPIKGLLTDIYAYLNDPAVDGFLKGRRLDDPNADCRTTAVILVYDNFNGCQNDNCNFLDGMRGGLNDFLRMGVPLYVVGLGASAGATANTGYCIAEKSGALVKTPTGTKVGYFPVESAEDLENALGDILGDLTESTKDFASASISSVQAGGEQMAYLATFNASKVRSIWNGRVSGYKLNEDGTIPLRNRTVRDAADAWNEAILKVPSNAPEVLIWNAGQNLVATPGTGATDPTAILAPGADPDSGTYADASTDITEDELPMRWYPGRKIVFSLPPGYAKDPDTGYPPALPIPPANTVPETRHDMTVDLSADWWPAMKALLGPQAGPPATDRLEDDPATEALRFIWGDRDAVTGAELDGRYIGLKLGDTFHSDPALIGPPSNFFYWSTNVDGYRDFVTAHKHRRRVLYTGANDGLLHAFDVGVWNRDQSVCATLGSGDQDSCFDLGTGLELFAYAPRVTMPIFHNLRTAESQDKTNEWTVDGAPASADVFIDPVHDGTPVEREWRTVVIGTAREGSPFQGTSGAKPYESYGSVFALDVTQPDVLPEATPPVPENLFKAPACLNGGTGCGPAAWPAILWEISDRGDLDSGTSGEGFADMGETWSKPGIGRVKICPIGGCTEAAPGVSKHVAIFGGGFDRERLNRRGNWLYMVDIETGKVVYRANSSCGVNGGSACVAFGSIPSEPVVLDLNGDGYVDVVYVGDLKGQMWRVDLSDLRELAAPPADRWANKISFASGSAKPFLLFQTPQPVATTVPPNQVFPIYQRPVVFAAAGNAVGVAFGTGDRDDILADVAPATLRYPQRFYVVMDRANTATKTETNLTALPDAVNPLQTVGPDGWYLKFETLGGERLITNAIALQGYLFFSTFRPNENAVGLGPCDQRSNCGRSSGRSKFYAVSVANGNPPPGSDERSVIVPQTDFVTSPIGYQSADMQWNLGFMTASGGFEKPNAPKRTTSSVREWKER